MFITVYSTNISLRTLEEHGNCMLEVAGSNFPLDGFSPASWPTPPLLYESRGVAFRRRQRGVSTSRKFLLWCRSEGGGRGCSDLRHAHCPLIRKFTFHGFGICISFGLHGPLRLRARACPAHVPDVLSSVSVSHLLYRRGERLELYKVISFFF